MPLNIIPYAYGMAANNHDTELGPLKIKESLKNSSLALHWCPALHSEDRHKGTAALRSVSHLNRALASKIRQILAKKEGFLTLGGDHSCAIGTWSGVANAINEPLGLLWIDAHLDSNTPQTTSSHNIHGMPLAVLLGFGEPELTHIQNPKPKILPENLVIIGARACEEKEEALLKSLGVKIFYMTDIEREGLQTIIQQALMIITKNTRFFGISLDLDALDPEDAPGVGYREPNGIRAQKLLRLLPEIIKHEHFMGMEIAEFNPIRDIDHKTEKIIIDLIELLC